MSKGSKKSTPIEARCRSVEGDVEATPLLGEPRPARSSQGFPLPDSSLEFPSAVSFTGGPPPEGVLKNQDVRDRSSRDQL